MKEKIQIAGTVYVFEGHKEGADLLASINPQQQIDLARPKDGQPLMPLRNIRLNEFDNGEFQLSIGQKDVRGVYFQSEDCLRIQLNGYQFDLYPFTNVDLKNHLVKFAPPSYMIF